jgi:hypothetical protein
MKNAVSSLFRFVPLAVLLLAALIAPTARCLADE